jgi:uncharacterized membrane protein (UPF0127 family)
MRRVLAVTAACVTLLGCGNDNEQSAPRAVVEVGGVSVTAEVADDEASRTRGLSGRDRLDPDAGMLFLLPGDSPSFWMKGMRFPIDIVWIKGGRVVDVTAGVQPPAGTNEALATYSPRRAANRALEVNAGWAARHNVEPGDGVRVRPAGDSG